MGNSSYLSEKFLEESGPKRFDSFFDLAIREKVLVSRISDDGLPATDRAAQQFNRMEIE